MNIVDCAIVGAGPAGLACALQAYRQGLSIALFEKAKPGGQALAANRIENYPGFPDGITGLELMDRFLSQVKSCGAEIRDEEVKNVKRSECGFVITTDQGYTNTRALVVASGLVPKRLGVPGEHELEGHHIFYYANAHEIAHEKKDVLIIGTGDAAFDQALSFSRRAKNVTIAMKYNEARCAQPLLRDVQKANIEILPSRNVASIVRKSDQLIVEFKNDESVRTDLVIACIGKNTCFDFMDSEILEAKPAAVFFAGDCHRNKDRHISIAIGDGISAAMAVEEFLKEQNSKLQIPNSK
ncbi:MAG: NAD(P)/FAD-dependent oxidoreductase [Pseudomonadota bacterium]